MISSACRRRARGRADTTARVVGADLLVANFDASEDSPVTVGSDDESLPLAPTAQRAIGGTVRRIYAEGIATGNATFETEVP
jgi:hypothetical protein